MSRATRDTAAARADAGPYAVHPGPGHELAAEPWLVFACGRYEGVDERVAAPGIERRRGHRSVSVGDTSSTGARCRRMTIVEAASRPPPGRGWATRRQSEETRTAC